MSSLVSNGWLKTALLTVFSVSRNVRPQYSDGATLAWRRLSQVHPASGFDFGQDLP
ncbi:MAG: hypothetical protein ACR2NI_05015 [Pirellulales bacterium]